MSNAERRCHECNAIIGVNNDSFCHSCGEFFHDIGCRWFDTLNKDHSQLCEFGLDIQEM